MPRAIGGGGGARQRNSIWRFFNAQLAPSIISQLEACRVIGEYRGIFTPEGPERYCRMHVSSAPEHMRKFPLIAEAKDLPVRYDPSFIGMQIDCDPSLLLRRQWGRVPGRHLLRGQQVRWGFGYDHVASPSGNAWSGGIKTHTRGTPHRASPEWTHT